MSSIPVNSNSSSVIEICVGKDFLNFVILEYVASPVANFH